MRWHLRTYVDDYHENVPNVERRGVMGSKAGAEDVLAAVATRNRPIRGKTDIRERARAQIQVFTCIMTIQKDFSSGSSIIVRFRA